MAGPNMIRFAEPGDAGQIADIYNYYIRATTITFEERPLSPSEMEERIREIAARWPFFVYCEGGQILGYAYADRFRTRSAYRYSAETTVYVRDGCLGNGIGTALYRQLIDALMKSDVRVLLGCIAMPNEESVRLHRKLGFEQVGYLRNVGYKFDRWLDVSYWELEHEAFSPTRLDSVGSAG